VKKKVILLSFLVLLIGVSVLVYLGQRNAKLKKLYYSGTLEAKVQSGLGFQVGGKVKKVLVDEGYLVERDQVLAELDPEEFIARKEEATANLDKAEKTLQELETTLRINQEFLPQDVSRAKALVTSARDTMEEAKKNKNRYDKLFEEKVVSEKEWDRITLEYDIARAQLNQNEALLAQAQSNLKKIETTKKEIEAAKAQVNAVQATLDLANLQLNYTTLYAPFKGIITTKNVEPGEVVTPNREVFTLSDLSTVDLKIFVDETEIGKVKPGQAVEVTIDTFSNKVYKGKVSYISPEGEFTPKIIQTHKERVKLVYLVKVNIPNPNLELKTGMPADAWLR
jgi:HlyD family secretion protein